MADIDKVSSAIIINRLGFNESEEQTMCIIQDNRDKILPITTHRYKL